MATGSTDPVKHPAHYVKGRRYQAIDVMCDWVRDLRGDQAHLRACALKYLARAGRKGDVAEDLEKARAYIDMELHLLRGEPLHD